MALPNLTTPYVKSSRDKLRGFEFDFLHESALFVSKRIVTCVSTNTKYEKRTNLSWVVIADMC